MKNIRRISFICLLGVLCSLSMYGQFWIDFRWNEPHCRSCGWMEDALRLSGSRAAEYHKIIHKYGEKIEREARRDYRYWDKSARKIYDLRIERDRRIQRILSPSQFRMYVRFVREDPKRIHDYRGWYSNPRYPGHRPSHDCRRYEDNYWNYRWDSQDDNHRPGRNDRYESSPNNHNNRSGRDSKPSRSRSKKHSDD